MRLAARGDQRSGSSQQLSGEILKTKRTKLQNTGKDHLVVLVETSQGNHRIVDLGPTSKFEDIDVQQGEKVLVQGRMARTRDDVPVLLARNVEIAGETVTIDRSSQSTNRDRSSN